MVIIDSFLRYRPDSQQMDNYRRESKAAYSQVQTAHSHDAQQVKVNTQTVLPAVDQRKPPRPCQIRTEHHQERDEHTTPLYFAYLKTSQRHRAF